MLENQYMSYSLIRHRKLYKQMYRVILLLCFTITPNLVNGNKSTGENIQTQAMFTTSAPSSEHPPAVANNSQVLEGYWFNRGSTYGHCPIRKEDSEKCKHVLVNHSGLDRTTSPWEPKHSVLLKRIECAIQKLNCPTTERSFQWTTLVQIKCAWVADAYGSWGYRQLSNIVQRWLHDVPCQSTCLSLLAYCQNAAMSNMNARDALLGCPTTMSNPVATNSWDLTSSNDEQQQFPSTLANANPNPYALSYNQKPSRQWYNRFRRPASPLIPRDVGRYSYDNLRNYNVQGRNQYPYSNGRYPWLPRYRQRRANSNGRLPRRNYRTVFEQNRLEPMHKMDFTGEDCHLLPPGGCDHGTQYMSHLDPKMLPSTQENLQVNSGCPKDVANICGSMFPRDMNKQQWIEGGFTVAAVIRISQTLWWFGENNRFQPFFRFHVVETLDSDIHPYEDKIILTYSWPTPCICPGEITNDKRYLMFTHSIKARQTLNITSETVFLPKVRRYTRKLSCWKGTCVRRNTRNRKRRYPGRRWRWTT